MVTVRGRLYGDEEDDGTLEPKGETSVVMGATRRGQLGGGDGEIDRFP